MAKTMDVVEMVILPTYLRHLARLVDNATPRSVPEPGECPVVTVPVDAKALREAADILQCYIDEHVDDDLGVT
jgi:hypothetical protein